MFGLKKKRRVGRPLKGGKKRTRVSFTLPPEHLEWLHRQSMVVGKSMSEVVERALYKARSGGVKAVREPSLQYDGGTRSHVAVSREKISNFCRKHHIQKLALFGSVLTDKFGPDSDVDILAQFEEGQAPGLFEMVSLEEKLSAIFHGYAIDLKTPQELSRYFRSKILEEAEVIYKK